MVYILYTFLIELIEWGIADREIFEVKQFGEQMVPVAWQLVQICLAGQKCVAKYKKKFDSKVAELVGSDDDDDDCGEIPERCR